MDGEDVIQVQLSFSTRGARVENLTNGRLTRNKRKGALKFCTKSNERVGG